MTTLPLDKRRTARSTGAKGVATREQPRNHAAGLGDPAPPTELEDKEPGLSSRIDARSRVTGCCGAGSVDGMLSLPRPSSSTTSRVVARITRVTPMTFILIKTSPLSPCSTTRGPKLHSRARPRISLQTRFLLSSFERCPLITVISSSSKAAMALTFWGPQASTQRISSRAELDISCPASHHALSTFSASARHGSCMSVPRLSRRLSTRHLLHPQTLVFRDACSSKGGRDPFDSQVSLARTRLHRGESPKCHPCAPCQRRKGRPLTQCHTCTVPAQLGLRTRCSRIQSATRCPNRPHDANRSLAKPERDRRAIPPRFQPEMSGRPAAWPSRV